MNFIRIIILVLMCFSARGATYYLWNGANGNGSFATPFNWSGGMGAAANGDTFIIRSNNFFTGPLTTANKVNLTIRAELKWTCGVTNSTAYCLALYSGACSGMTIDGLQIANSFQEDGLAVNHNQNVTIRNCWIHDCDQNGINSTTGCHDNLAEYNLLERNGAQKNNLGQWAYPFHYHNAYFYGANNIFRNNVSRYDGGGHGAIFYSEVDSGTSPSDVIESAINNQIYNNIIYGNTNGGYDLAVWGGMLNGSTMINLGTNYVFNNYIGDTILAESGYLWDTNNIILPCPGNVPLQIGNFSPTVVVHGGYNMSTQTIYSGDVNDVITTLVGIGFVNSSKGLYWILSGSQGRGNAKSNIIPPVNFFGSLQSTMSDIGPVQYDFRRILATVTLDPSSSTGANYWITNDPAITGQPSSQSVASGSPATFSVTANGSLSLSYQWYSNNVAIPGATSSSYTTPNTTASFNGGTYFAAVTDAISTTNSTSVGLTVTGGGGTAPTISVQPASQSVACGATASFNVTAAGSAPLTYYWMKGSVAVGTSVNSYTTPATDATYDGVAYSVLVSNAVGTATSANAVLTVTGCFPTITVQPSGQSVACGATATFSVTATSSLSLSYQWQKNGNTLVGANSASYTTPATDATYNNAAYNCIVSTSAGNATSQNASLIVTGCNPVSNIGTVTSLKAGNAYIGP